MLVMPLETAGMNTPNNESHKQCRACGKMNHFQKLCRSSKGRKSIPKPHSTHRHPVNLVKENYSFHLSGDKEVLASLTTTLISSNRSTARKRKPRNKRLSKSKLMERVQRWKLTLVHAVTSCHWKSTRSKQQIPSAARTQPSLLAILATPWILWVKLSWAFTIEDQYTSSIFTSPTSLLIPWSDSRTALHLA